VSAPVLRVTRLAKSFGAQLALREVSLDVRPGEIHALLGENGAGKSTLIKILAGVYQSDGGEVAVSGRLAFVHQDLGLVETLSVADNVALETGYARRGPFVSPARTSSRVAALLDRLGIDVRPDMLVAELTQDQKVMVAVARALGQDATVVVLDEVSASLPAPEMAALSEALRASRNAGVAYLFVTHRIDEVFELADRVTVLRDGRVRATAAVTDTTHEQVVEWITGQAVEPHPVPVRGARGTGCRLAVHALAGDGLSAPVSFEVAAGEIVGVCGLIGSGTRALAALLGGDRRPAGGWATLDGTRLPLGDSRRLRQAGAMFVPGDRQLAGAVGDLSIRENFFLARGRGRDVRDSSLIRPQTERRAAGTLATRFTVRPVGSVERPLATLSGGNQQKVVLGRALRSRPRLLVLEDPTAGVDIGSRIELHRLFQAAADDGAAVLLISTDFDEVATQSHRALVMAGGRLVAELSGGELDSGRLAAASYRAAEPAPR
jgi:ribose transport system ATP-binding protein